LKKKLTSNLNVFQVEIVRPTRLFIEEINASYIFHENKTLLCLKTFCEIFLHFKHVVSCNFLQFVVVSIFCQNSNLISYLFCFKTSLQINGTYQTCRSVGGMPSNLSKAIACEHQINCFNHQFQKQFSSTQALKRKSKLLFVFVFVENYSNFIYNY
jgi:hypothetical protein